MIPPKYYIAVVSKDHTVRAVAGGFIQACHGKKTPVAKMGKGDWIVVYSSRLSMNGIDKCQAFTAIGRANDDLVYQYEMSDEFKPYRRNIDFYNCCEISILPLIDQLDFITDKRSWGFPFRYGFLEIGQADFQLISSQMIMHEIKGQSF